MDFETRDFRIPFFASLYVSLYFIFYSLYNFYVERLVRKQNTETHPQKHVT